MPWRKTVLLSELLTYASPSSTPIEPGTWLQRGIMTFQETLQHLSPTVRAQLQPFLEVLQLHLSPTDWERMLTFIDRMDPEQRAALMVFLAQRETHAPAVGTEAPDFELPRLGSDERVRLSEFRNHQPVALIFGSFS